MKVVHLCLGCFYIEGYTYQENILPKFHKRMGHDVEIIASLESFDSRGRHVCLPFNQKPFFNEHGIKVTRLNYRHKGKLRKLKKFIGLSNALEVSSPDLLFIHGCQFGDMDVVVDYVNRHQDVRVYVDNHADYSNSATNFFSKVFLHRFLWKRSAQMILPYTSRFWGVLPARVDFLKENYGIPAEKCGLLVMGADDDEVERALDLSKRSETRERYGISSDDRLIVTGGKIDKFKTQTLNLMEAIAKDEDKKVKLIVFGPIDPDLRDKAARFVDDSRVIHIPWANSSDSYDLFAASDLVVFPGRHSVYWEQVVALGKPMLVKRWEGTEHVDVCGNVRFTFGDDVASLCSSYKSILNDAGVFCSMCDSAKKASSKFLYSRIAKQSIEMIEA